jgi:hypothetical protein
MGPSALTKFLTAMPRRVAESIPMIHLSWPTPWDHHVGGIGAVRLLEHGSRAYWFNSREQKRVKEQWEALWHALGYITLEKAIQVHLRKFHITIRHDAPLHILKNLMDQLSMSGDDLLLETRNSFISRAPESTWIPFRVERYPEVGLYPHEY